MTVIICVELKYSWITRAQAMEALLVSESNPMKKIRKVCFDLKRIIMRKMKIKLKMSCYSLIMQIIMQ